MPYFSYRPRGKGEIWENGVMSGPVLTSMWLFTDDTAAEAVVAEVVAKMKLL